MIIKLDELRVKSGQRQNFEYSTTVVEDIKVVEPLEVEGVVEYVEDEILIRGSYAVKISTPCVKCLEEVVIELSGEFDGHYGEPSKYRKHLEGLSKEAEVADNYLEEAINGEINITELVREFIILDMPPYPACEPACDGLEELEKYADNGVDLRWQELLNLNK